MHQKRPATPSRSAVNGPFRYLFVIAFIEGASVMAIELAGAKMIAPYYGSSLYVWAAVLSVTLGGLTSGYFLGGRLAYRYPGTGLLFAVLLLGTLLTATMPFLPDIVMHAIEGLGVRTGALMSALSFMLLPLVCMGMVSPIIIQLATRQLNETGRVAGTVYAVSTVGGIIMTLLMGFYLLPEWGIRNAVFLTASLLGLTLALFFALVRGGTPLVPGGLYLCFLIFLFVDVAQPESAPQDGLTNIKYRCEGILGQITVLDHIQTNTNRVVRLLLLNEIPQTKVAVEHMPISDWSYPHRLATLASIKPKGVKALLIGMGGGSVAMELQRMGFNLDIVEIDDRMPKTARNYFAFSGDGIRIVIDDGRHYLRSARESYELVVIDVLNGEVQPFQLFTQEAFAELKRSLAPEALLLINYQGYFDGANGKPARAIYKTLQESGFLVKHQTTSTETASGDVTLIASMVEQDFHALDSHRLNNCCISMNFAYSDLVTDAQVKLDDVYVLTDDKPQLEALSHRWNEQWRQKAIREYDKCRAPWFH